MPDPFQHKGDCLPEAERSWRGAGGRFVGLVPEEYQCIRIRRNGRRCRKARIKGATCCKYHGGKWQSWPSTVVKLYRLPMFYSKVLGPTLKSYVEQCLDLEPHEQFDLVEEVMIMKGMMSQSIAMYEAACALPDGPKKLAVVVMAGDSVKQGLKDVADMAHKAAQIRASMKDKVSVHNIQYVINQIIRIAHESMPEGAEAFESLVRSHVKLPTAGVQGTTITPDQDVLDMDSTIPKGDDDENVDDFEPVDDNGDR